MYQKGQRFKTAQLKSQSVIKCMRFQFATNMRRSYEQECRHQCPRSTSQILKASSPSAGWGIIPGILSQSENSHQLWLEFSFQFALHYISHQPEFEFWSQAQLSGSICEPTIWSRAQVGLVIHVGTRILKVYTVRTGNCQNGNIKMYIQGLRRPEVCKVGTLPYGNKGGWGPSQSNLLHGILWK